MYELYSFKYSIPYLILALFLGISSLGEVYFPVKKKYFIFFSFSIYLLFFGFRGEIGSDWYSYIPVFEQLPTIFELKDEWEFIQTIPMEPGFLIYVSFFKTIWNNWYFFLFVDVLVDCVFLYVFFKKYSMNLSFSLFILFVLNLDLQHDMLRNIKAILLFCISLQYVESRDFMPFLILWLLACCFHMSAVIYFPMYFLLHRNYSLKIIIGTFIVAHIIYFFLPEVISQIVGFLVRFAPSERYQAYIGMSFNRGFSLSYLLYMLLFVLVCADYNSAKQKSVTLIYNCFFLFFFIFLLFSGFSEIARRLAQNFFFAIWVIIPVILCNKKLFEKIHLSNFRTICCCFIFLAGIFRIFMATDNIMYFYDNFFSPTFSYEERSSIKADCDALPPRTIVERIFNM